MEPETAQVLMEIQSTFQAELADKSDLNCDSDESGKTKKYGVPFQKLLSCLKCGKAFTTKSSLDCHEEIHTGEKPFSCSKCDKKFSESGSLKKHEKIHT